MWLCIVIGCSWCITLVIAGVTGHAQAGRLVIAGVTGHAQAGRLVIAGVTGHAQAGRLVIAGVTGHAQAGRLASRANIMRDTQLCRARWRCERLAELFEQGQASMAALIV